MKRTLFTICLGILATTLATAQVTEVESDLLDIDEEIEDGWQTGGLFSLSFSQISLTNWAAGGQNSLSGNSIVSMFADYRRGSISWNNSLDLGYGLLKQEDEGVRKNDDKVDIVSKAGMRAAENWFYAGLVNFRTQMAPGYRYPNDSVAISRFLAPAYLLGAIGMDYQPDDRFTLFLAPLTGKLTLVTDPDLSAQGAFGVDPGEKTYAEFGGYLRAQYRRTITENISVRTKIDIFSNYLEKPQNLDINWEALVMMNVTRYITLSFATHLIYDESVMIPYDSTGDGVADKSGPKVQFKQLLGAGLSYRF
ncbi:MAG: DUF3078 domain-containing protein [Marinilabiliales bacterium]|nr:MAG: DUF3078 domain-containing protein [Marinilabiliales bacterium]